MGRTIYWHDYETFGADPRRDRAAQFAGIRTDEDLNIIGEPLMLFCKPAPDMLPHPQASLVTGISPRQALEEGVNEAEFISRILAEFCQPGTCVAGYNSIRFDDELTRQLLYRNFHDPYEREWKNGNSRWDIIDMVRLCAATRPDGIVWPRREDGAPSFRLELLTAANGIAHASAHDALSDVLATIEMARLIRARQPRLYQHIYDLRSKKAVQAVLDLQKRTPVLHVSMMYPSSQGCLALVMPLCRHPVDANGVIVCDLRTDPASWLGLPVEELRRLLFTPQSSLGEGEARVPLKTVHLNRCPVVVPASVLEPEIARRHGVDVESCRRHRELLMTACDDPSGLLQRIAQAFDRRLEDAGLGAEEELPLEDDPDFMIYSGGFLDEHDRRCLSAIRNCAAEDLKRLRPDFHDGRLHEMLFRYRARNWPDTLDENELQRWVAFCRERLSRDPSVRAAGASLTEFRREMGLLRQERTGERDLAILRELEDYADSLLTHLQLLPARDLSLL